MSSSGVGVHQECLETFQSFKMGKKLKFIIFGLSKDNKEIVVLKASESKSYDEFLAELPETECAWAVYDMEFEKPDGGKRNKIIFMSWSPDDAQIKSKMLHASSKEALRRSLVGIAMEFQCTDYSEISYESVLERVSRSS